MQFFENKYFCEKKLNLFEKSTFLEENGRFVEKKICLKISYFYVKIVFFFFKCYFYLKKVLLNEKSIYNNPRGWGKKKDLAPSFRCSVPGALSGRLSTRCGS